MKLWPTIELQATGRRLQGRRVFQGLKISIENRKGSVRRGKDKDGSEWKTKMRAPYGYIRMTIGQDEEHVDCYVGPNENAKNAYIINQKDNITGRMDEQKVMLGYDSPEEAKEAFLQHYDDPRFFGSMTSMPMEEFKKKVLKTRRGGKRILAGLLDGNRLSVGDQVSVFGLKGRGIVIATKGDRYIVKYRGGYQVERGENDIVRIGGRIDPPTPRQQVLR